MLSKKQKVEDSIYQFIEYQGCALAIKHISSILSIPIKEVKEAVWAMVEKGELEFTSDYLIKIKK